MFVSFIFFKTKQLFPLLLVILGVIGLNNSGFAQKPKGRFLSDSLSIGKPIQFALSYRHSPSLDVFFPDTLHDFSPFEFVSWQPFTTQTNKSGSLDSVVYTLRTFEIDAVQSLKLPVIILRNNDSLVVYTAPDSVVLRQLIKGSTKNLRPLTNLPFMPLEQEINYPFILFGVFIFCVLVAIVNWIFGDGIKKWLRVFQLLQRDLDFSRNFNRLRRVSSGKIPTVNLEKALVLWKKYMERLERKPFSSFTTKEIIDTLPDDRLAEALKAIDMAIYGGANANRAMDSLETLKNIANRSYLRRRIEVRKRKKITQTEGNEEG